MKQVGFWFCLGFLAVVTASQAVWGLAVTPGRTEVRLSTGAHVENFITATNDAQETIHVSVSTKDWFVSPANRSKQLTVDAWLELQGPKEFDLKPGETRTVRILTRCPHEAEGDLVAMVSFLYRASEPSTVTPMISVSVFLEVEGTARVAGEIKELTVRTWQGKLQAAVSVLSTGNVLLRPAGALAFFDKKGKPLARFPIKASRPAYAGKSQAYFADVPADYKLEPGRFKVRAELEYRGVQLISEKGFTVSKNGDIEMSKS